MRPSSNLENKALSDTYWKVEPAASMDEISGPQLFRNTTGIQSGPDAFDESRFVVSFITLELQKYYPVSD